MNQPSLFPPTVVPPVSHLTAEPHGATIQILRCASVATPSKFKSAKFYQNQHFSGMHHVTTAAAAGRSVEASDSSGAAAESGGGGRRLVPINCESCSAVRNIIFLEVKGLRAKMAACEAENEELRRRLTLLSLEGAFRGAEFTEDDVDGRRITLDMLKGGGIYVDEEEEKVATMAAPLPEFKRTPKRFAAYTRRNKVKLTATVAYKSEAVFLNKFGVERMQSKAGKIMKAAEGAEAKVAPLAEAEAKAAPLAEAEAKAAPLKAKEEAAPLAAVGEAAPLAAVGEAAPLAAKPATPLAAIPDDDNLESAVLRAKLTTMLRRHSLPIGAGGVSPALVQRLVRDYAVHVSYKAMRDVEGMADVRGMDVEGILQGLLDKYEVEAEIEKRRREGLRKGAEQ